MISTLYQFKSIYQVLDDLKIKQQITLPAFLVILIKHCVLDDCIIEFYHVVVWLKKRLIAFGFKWNFRCYLTKHLKHNLSVYHKLNKLRCRYIHFEMELRIFHWNWSVAIFTCLCCHVFASWLFIIKLFASTKSNTNCNSSRLCRQKKTLAF